MLSRSAPIRAIRTAKTRLEGRRSRHADYCSPIASAEEGNARIAQIVASGQPAMIARMGSTELACVQNYLEIVQARSAKRHERIRFLLSGGIDYWQENVRVELRDVSGFFPATDENLGRFAEAYLEGLTETNVLGVWFRPHEAEVHAQWCPSAELVALRGLEPYYHQDPWTRELRGKRVLVVHPFARSVERQYARREDLFENEEVLPEFDLLTVPALQTNAGTVPNFEDWFEALDVQAEHIAELEFDIAVIGAGSYGLPLAARIKRMGKIAVQMGGATQILFGIKGRRWEDHPEISALFNASWVRPEASETPRGFELVERGAYW